MSAKVRIISRLAYSLWVFLAIGSASRAQETFQYVGNTGTQTWESAANWSGGSGSFSSYPGESPDSGTLDNADLTGARTESLELVISTPGLVLDVLTLGSTELAFVDTAVSGTPGASISVSHVESAGSLISLNRISADLLLRGDLDITSTTTGLTLDGQVINGAPTEDLFRTIVNDTNQTLHVDGNVILSDDPNNAGSLRFINGGVSQTRITGVISDGSAPGGRVTYARGTFDMLTSSTYTGTTTLGDNDPNVGSTHIIHTDTPFGLGRLTISGGNELKVIRSASGKGTRTLNNEIQIAREVAFSGQNDIVLNGIVFQSNGRRFTNNIGDDNSLTMNGNIFASNSDDVREWTFNGAGTTIVNSQIDDSRTNPLLTGASVAKEGLGRVIFTNPAVAAYTGRTTIREGILQLGNGGDAVDLNDDTVSGEGTLEFNHSTALTFSPVISGSVNVLHTGPGTTTLDRISTGDGDFTVSAGTLLVDSGDGVTSGTGSGNVLVAGGTLGGGGAVAGLVTVGSNGSLAPGASVGVLTVGQVTFESGSAFEVELAGGNGLAGVDFDQLVIAGNASLGGTLDVSLLAPFTPSLGQVFEIIEVGGALSGSFVELPQGAHVGILGGVDLFIDYNHGDGNDVALIATHPGDFDLDGKVDGLDFLKWQRGESPVPFSASDLSDWESHYGSAASLLTASTTVPEPSACMMLLLGITSALTWPKR